MMSGVRRTGLLSPSQSGLETEMVNLGDDEERMRVKWMAVIGYDRGEEGSIDDCEGRKWGDRRGK